MKEPRYFSRLRFGLRPITGTPFTRGMIVAFSGTTLGIPHGWLLCNGSKGTPNLLDRFVLGSTVAGSTGGAHTVTIGVTNLPAHSHSCSTAGNHAHTSRISDPYGPDDYYGVNTDGYCDDTYVPTTAAGDHAHTIGNTGGGVGLVVTNPYYMLLYIMKS